MESPKYIAHHGVKGQKWGVRKYQYENGTLTPEGRAHYLGERKNQTVFVSGSSKTQDKESGYYLKKLPYSVRYELKEHMKRGDKIIVGDAPGIDRQTQDYLAKKKYTNVEVFSPGKEGARYLANPGWKQTNVDKPGAEIGSKEWLAAKDFVMSNLADKGIAVTIDEGAKATRKNVDRLVEANKESAYRKLHNDGYRPSEIAKMLGESTKDDGKPSGETRAWAAKYKVNKNDISSLKARQNRARSLQSSGKTIAEIADIMGAPVSSIKDYLYEDFDSLR